MTRFLISTALAGVLAFAGATSAQPDDHDRQQDRTGHSQTPQPARPAGPQAAHPAPAAAPDRRTHVDNRPSAGRQAAPAAAPAPANAMRGPTPGNAMRGPAPGNAMRGPSPGNAMRGPAPGGNPNFATFHRNINAAHRYHAPVYHQPRGWYSHRWVFGEVLPSLFWTHDYWLDDYTDFGLMPPPPGTVWVRDGSDALLLDQTTGEIIQVDYSVFY